MIEATYQNILVQVKQLSMIEQLRLMEAILRILQNKTVLKKQRSICELRGLGKTIWKNVDAQEYVNQERKY